MNQWGSEFHGTSLRESGLFFGCRGKSGLRCAVAGNTPSAESRQRWTGAVIILGGKENCAHELENLLLAASEFGVSTDRGFGENYGRRPSFVPRRVREFLPIGMRRTAGPQRKRLP